MSGACSSRACFSSSLEAAEGSLVVEPLASYGGGGGASPSGSEFLLEEGGCLLVAKSYEGGSRRPCGRGLEGLLASWQ